MFLLTAALAAQDLAEQGARVFRASCAQGYCHGAGGTQGRAPKLIGRMYEQAAVEKIIASGVPNTGMPGFRNQLPADQFEAVLAYVLKISGGTYTASTSGTAAAQTMPMPADAKQGREHFFDAVRGIHRCSTCHAVEGMGNAIGPNLVTPAPGDAAFIRNGKPAAVRLATHSSGDKFPALVVQQGEWTKVYDLTTPPPVLRTFAKGEVTFGGNSPWSHANAVKGYSDPQLEQVAAYLRWLATQ
jgi:mono/diheme cytochrome c family protein